MGPRPWSSPWVRPSHDSLLPFLSVTPPVLHPRGQRLHRQVTGRSEVNIVPVAPTSSLAVRPLQVGPREGPGPCRSQRRMVSLPSEWASPMAQRARNPPATQETQVQSLGWEDSPGEGNGNPLQYSRLENPHGQRSLAGYSPWGHKESDTTE